MVKLPDTILREMSKLTNGEGHATRDDMIRHYLMNGYGRNKAQKWIQTYYDIGVLVYVGRDDKEEPLYSCVWWD